MNKYCSTCKYKYDMITEEPCHSCRVQYSNWKKKRFLGRWGKGKKLLDNNPNWRARKKDGQNS